MPLARGVVVALSLLLFASVARAQFDPCHLPFCGSAFVTGDLIVGSELTFHMQIFFTPSDPPGCRDFFVLWSDGESLSESFVPQGVTYTYWRPGTFVVTGGSRRGCIVSVHFTVAENPAFPEFYFPQLVTTVAETTPTARIYVHRSKNVGSASVRWRTVAGRGLNVRYVPSEGTLDFADGVTRLPLDIPILNDDVVNGTEQFFVELEPLTAGYSAPPPHGIVTITDEDSFPIFRFRDSRRTLQENSGVTTLFADCQLRGEGSLAETSFRPATSATFVTAIETAHFLQGVTAAPFNITILDDHVYTGTRTAAIRQTDVPQNYVTGPDMLLDVLDDEPAPFLSIDDSTATEGAVATLHVALTGPVAVPLEVPFTFSGAATPLTPSPLVFPPGVLVKDIRLATSADTVPEADSEVVVSLGAVTLPVTKRTGTCIVVDDDDGFTADGVQLLRGATAPLELHFSGAVAVDRTIEIESASPAIAAGPSSVVVPAHARSASIDVAGYGEGTTTIAAIIGATRSTAAVTVYQPLAPVFEPRALTMTSGEVTVATARIEPPRDADVRVELTAHDPAALEVPSVITIPPGGTTPFEIRARRAGGGSVRARVLAPFGETSALPVDVFDAVPAIVRITPASGPAAGNTGVAIDGSHLVAGCTLAFGGVAARDARTVDAGRMTAITPAHAAGAVDVTLTCGATTSVLRGGFTFIADGKRRAAR